MSGIGDQRNTTRINAAAMMKMPNASGCIISASATCRFSRSDISWNGRFILSDERGGKPLSSWRSPQAKEGSPEVWLRRNRRGGSAV
jgi:hypothetical protein